MSARKKSSVLWQYFEKDNTTFKAKCNECKDSLSFKSSTANLKSHLRRKHPSLYLWVFGADDQPVLTSQREQETRPDAESTPEMNAKPTTYRGRNGPVWRYITEIDTENRFGTCSLCFTRLSFKSTTGNLRQHLIKRHGIDFSSLENDSEIYRDSEHKNASDQSDSEQSTTLDPDNELWGFFDKEPRNRAKCSMCGVVLRRETDTLYKHLKESHSRISENLEFRDNEENYTEVIYLEDPVSLDNKESNKNKFDNVKIETPSSPQPKRPKRRHSYKEPLRVSNSQNIPTEFLKKDKISPHDEEIENFGRYITGLLKAVPKGTCTKLQMDIVNLIMTAKLKSMEPTPTITINGTIEVQSDKTTEEAAPMDDDTRENEAAETNLEASTTERKLESKKPPDKTSLLKKRKSFTYTEDYIKSTDQEEVENFGKYITCLLKSVSNRDVGTKLQMDIVSLIMSARLKIADKSSVLTISGTIEMNKNTDSVGTDA